MELELAIRAPVVFVGQCGWLLDEGDWVSMLRRSLEGRPREREREREKRMSGKAPGVGVRLGIPSRCWYSHFGAVHHVEHVPYY